MYQVFFIHDIFLTFLLSPFKMSEQSEQTTNEVALLFPKSAIPQLPDTKRMLLARLCLFVTETKMLCDTSNWNKQFMETLLQHLQLDDPPVREAITAMAHDDLNSEDIGEMVQRIFDAVPTLENTITNMTVKEAPAVVEEPSVVVEEINDDFMSHREKVMLELILLYIGMLSEETEGGMGKPDQKPIAHTSSTSTKASKGKLEPGEYDARSRAVLYYLAEQLQLPHERMSHLERWIAQQLYFARENAEAKANTLQDEDATEDDEASTSKLSSMAQTLKKAVKNRNKQSRILRWTVTGTSVIIGAAALGLTGGLAAPMLAVGMGALGIAGAHVIATAGGIMLVTSLFGVAGGGLAGYKTARRTGGLKEFTFIPLLPDAHLPLIPSLHATIVVPGYLKPETDAATPWRDPCATHMADRDVYALAYDTEVLQELGKAFREFLATEAAGFAAGQVLKHTVLAALMTPLAWPMALVKAGKLIDNPWGMAIDRARKAGHVLADVLQEHVQGHRPISLVGYSVGALAIFECLQVLADRHCYGIIDSVVLLGAPIEDEPEPWNKVRSVVARRFINGYAGNDWILAFLCRVHDAQFKVAGLRPIKAAGVESVNLEHLIPGHLGYRKQLDAIMTHIGMI
ncbi:hypothetical protein BDF22DRAFT_670241 [Syncephalis plumigaleata]|nr:hypothetical protein BDF22DRAFT_670241 [Syncephalis plumigaleata]